MHAKSYTCYAYITIDTHRILAVILKRLYSNLVHNKFEIHSSLG